MIMTQWVTAGGMRVAAVVINRWQWKGREERSGKGRQSSLIRVELSTPYLSIPPLLYQSMGIEIHTKINQQNSSEAAPVILGLQPSALVDHVARVDWSLLSQIAGESGGSFPVILLHPNFFSLQHVLFLRINCTLFFLFSFLFAPCASN